MKRRLLVFRRGHAPTGGNLIFVSPHPSTRERARVIGSRLNAILEEKLGAESVPALSALSDPEYIRRITPAYVYANEHEDRLNFGGFDRALGARIQAEMGDFDQDLTLRSLKDPLYLLLGEKDFIQLEDFPVHFEKSNSTKTFRGCGHSSFLESSDEFRAFLRQVLC